MLEMLQVEPTIFIEKSRDMMLSWLCVGFFTHAAMEQVFVPQELA
jgi:hypothetical protein